MNKSAADIFNVIAKITAEEAAVDVSTISATSRFVEDLDVDSLGLLTIATQVEEQLAVTLEDALIPKLVTVGDLVDLVVTKKQL